MKPPNIILRGRTLLTLVSVRVLVLLVLMCEVRDWLPPTAVPVLLVEAVGEIISCWFIHYSLKHRHFINKWRAGHGRQFSFLVGASVRRLGRCWHVIHRGSDIGVTSRGSEDVANIAQPVFVRASNSCARTCLNDCARIIGVHTIELHMIALHIVDLELGVVSLAAPLYLMLCKGSSVQGRSIKRFSSGPWLGSRDMFRGT